MGRYDGKNEAVNSSTKGGCHGTLSKSSSVALVNTTLNGCFGRSRSTFLRILKSTFAKRVDKVERQRKEHTQWKYLNDD